MATPHVAGAAALALSASPAATHLAAASWALLSSVDAKPALAGKSVTGGRLNADGAVAAITGQGPLAVPGARADLDADADAHADRDGHADRRRRSPPPPPVAPVATPTPVAADLRARAHADRRAAPLAT